MQQQHHHKQQHSNERWGYMDRRICHGDEHNQHWQGVEKKTSQDSPGYPIPKQLLCQGFIAFSDKLLPGLCAHQTLQKNRKVFVEVSLATVTSFEVHLSNETKNLVGWLGDIGDDISYPFPWRSMSGIFAYMAMLHQWRYIGDVVDFWIRSPLRVSNCLEKIVSGLGHWLMFTWQSIIGSSI